MIGSLCLESGGKRPISSFSVQAVNGAFSSISICMAYVADLIMPEHRAATFGLILCSFSVGILVGPLGGGYIHPPLASILALAGLCFCVLYVVLFIPESSSLESRQKVKFADLHGAA